MRRNGCFVVSSAQPKATFSSYAPGFINVSAQVGSGYSSGPEGRYFVCAHGACAEVSSCLWNYSYWHAVTATGGIVLVFAEAAALLNTGDIELD